MGASVLTFSFTSASLNANVNATKPTGTAIGDLLLVFHFATTGAATASWTGPAGWTKIAPVSGSVQGAVWWKFATSTETAASTYQFGNGNGLANQRIYVLRITQASPLGPIDDFDYSSNASGANSAGTVVPNYTDTLLIDFWGAPNAAMASLAVPGGMTSGDLQTASPARSWAYQTGVGTGSVTKTWTNTSTVSVDCLLAIRNASVAYTASVGDVAAAAETPARKATNSRAPSSEGAHAADTTTRKYSPPRAISDAAHAGDTNTRKATNSRAVPDAAPAVDSVARKATNKRTSSEAAAAADSNTRKTVATRAGTDVAAATDSNTRRTVGARMIAETAPASASPARATAAKRTASENAAAADSLARKTVAKRTNSETAPATDTPARKTVGKRAASETAAATDTNARHTAASRQTGDSSASADDSVRTFSGYRRPAAESAPAADSLTRHAVDVRSTSETAPAAGTPARKTAAARAIPDTAPAVDQNVRSFTGYRRTADELAGAEDTVTRLITFPRAFTENAPAADFVTRYTSPARAITDYAPAAESIVRKYTIGRNITEGPADIVPYPGFKEILGKAYDPDGNPIEGVEVWLVRLADDRHVRTTTTDSDGIFVFGRDLYDVQEYVVYGFTTDPDNPTVQWADVSDRGLTVVDTGSVAAGSPLNGLNPNLYLLPQGFSGGGGVGRKIFPIFD